ncbi:hypothetical protein ACFLZP_03520 [Patescibacteria group bacterium]
MKKIVKVFIVFIVFIALMLLLTITFQSKGSWVCEDGQWVKLGNPRGLPPTSGCLVIPTSEPTISELLREKPGTPFGGPSFPGSAGWRLFPAEMNRSTSSAQ